MRINYSREPLKETIKTHTGGLGADVVYDPVGGELCEQALRATAWDGRYLVIGFASGTIPRIPLNLPLLKGCDIIGVMYGGWMPRDPSGVRENMNELLDMHQAGQLDPLVTQVFQLDQYVDAFATLTERRARGKVVFSLK